MPSSSAEPATILIPTNSLLHLLNGHRAVPANSLSTLTWNMSNVANVMNGSIWSVYPRERNLMKMLTLFVRAAPSLRGTNLEKKVRRRKLLLRTIRQPGRFIRSGRRRREVWRRMEIRRKEAEVRALPRSPQGETTDF